MPVLLERLIPKLHGLKLFKLTPKLSTTKKWLLIINMTTLSKILQFNFSMSVTISIIDAPLAKDL